MKRLLFTILLFTAAQPAAAQLYHPGEQLFYRVSYKAKMFPLSTMSFSNGIRRITAWLTKTNSGTRRAKSRPDTSRLPGG